jgi:hypothetical protein
MKKEDFFGLLGLITFGIIILGIGFYFGYKVSNNSKNQDLITLQAQQIEKEVKQPVEYITKEVPEVYFVAGGGEPNCPESHPIKGKFSSTGNIFYTEDHKSYKRVIAEICFNNLDYAKNIAKFNQKM